MIRCPLSVIWTLVVFVLVQPSAHAGEPPQDALDRAEPAEPPPETPTSESICLLVESAARANDLPLAFFARVIWQESRFRPNEVGPQTRSGSRAEGIAQFMPGTAAERGLLDPFDPVQALPKSAEFLRDLRHQFGNLGLAAAAYNAGPQRVRDWMAGRGTMPAETRRYVLAITGRSIDAWGNRNESGEEWRMEQATGCRELMALLKQQPNSFVTALTKRIELGAASPWGVQLSAGFSRDRALASYETLAKRYAEVLAGTDPMIIRSAFYSRGHRPFYQVRVGAQTRTAADALCARLHRVGGPCLVLRNSAGPS